jgi:hypothetical protein
VWFAYSLAYSLLEGAAEALEVPSADLSVTVKQSETGAQIPQIILYDNVPGGAGLVARLESKTSSASACKRRSTVSVESAPAARTRVVTVACEATPASSRTLISQEGRLLYT